MAGEPVRLSFVEDYDRNAGFIEDGMVELTPQRKTFMARPSIRFVHDMGAFAPSRFPATVYNPQVSTGLVFTLNNVAYAATMFSAQSSAAYPSVVNYGVGLYNLKTLSAVGSTTLYPVNLFIASAQPQFGRMWPIDGIYNIIVSISVVAGGAGYTAGDDLTPTTGSGQQMNIHVLTVDGGGAVLTAAIVSLISTHTGNLYTVLPDTTISVTGGSGAGAQFTYNSTPVSGVLAQTGIADEIYGVFTDGTNVYSRDLHQDDSKVSVTYLSGFAFYLDAQGLIWNSAAGDVTSWNGLSFTQAFSNGGSVPITLQVHQGYLVAFAVDEVRLFFVTGATPGSAVAPVLNTSYGIGAYSQQTVAAANEYLAFVGAPDGTAYPVYIFLPNSQVPERISFPYLENLLSSETPTTAEFITFRGHLAFCINTASGHSYIFDTHTKLWYRWNPFLTDGTNYALLHASVTANGTYAFAHDPATDHYYLMYLQAANDDLKFGSVASPYTPFVVLNPTDLGLMNRKQWKSVALVGDQTSNAVSAQLSYSDDNNQTFSTPRSIALNQQYPVARNLGNSRKRAWKLQLPTDWQAREDFLEINFGVGSM